MTDEYLVFIFMVDECWSLYLCWMNTDIYVGWMLIYTSMLDECWSIHICWMNTDLYIYVGWMLFIYVGWILIYISMLDECWSIYLCWMNDDLWIYVGWIVINITMLDECWSIYILIKRILGERPCLSSFMFFMVRTWTLMYIYVSGASIIFIS